MVALVSWQPGPHPAWVDAINSGRLPAPAADVPSEISAAAPEVLADHHRPLADGQDLDGAPEGFAVFVDALEAEADLSPLGRWATRRYLHRLLDGRRRLERELEDGNGARDATILEPVFVIGAPRTGTTVIHRLLSTIPGLRTPRGWELLYPLPTTSLVTEGERVAAAAEELVFPQAVATGLNAVHQYSSQMPKECLSAMSFAGQSEEFISRYNVPTYVAWLQSQSPTAAYAAHRHVLQVLQDDQTEQRWLLKSPVHLQAIPELIATYPDARFVITHRDPADVLASVSSLVCTLRSAFSDRVDGEAVGGYHLDLYARSLDALVDLVDDGTLPADRTVHVHHRDVVADAPALVDRACEVLGIELDDNTRAAIGAAHDAPRADALGRHHYDAADFGLADVDVGGSFGRYLDRFDIG